MTGPILVDTDVLIDYLRGHPQAVSFVRRHADAMILSSIVIAELYAGVRGDDELAALDRFVSVFRIVPVSPTIARLAGLMKQAYHASHGLGLADAILAATASIEGAALKTLNVRHYPMFEDLTPAYVK